MIPAEVKAASAVPDRSQKTFYFFIIYKPKKKYNNYFWRYFMDVYRTITSRRTIRKFKQKKIDPKLLEKLINAVRLAPSAANLQSLEYLIITDQTLKEKIFPELAWAGYIKPEGNPREGEKPEVYIIILINKKIDTNPEKDIGASAENINLAALEEGIGCCWIGAFRKKPIVRILNIPENYSIGLIMALGYPAEKPIYEDVDKNSSIKYYKDSSGTLHVPKRKLDDIIHFNYFKDKKSKKEILKETKGLLRNRFDKKIESKEVVDKLRSSQEERNNRNKEL